MANMSYLSPKAEVRDSLIEGKGLFAKGTIRKGEVVCIKGGYIFNRQTRDEAGRTLGPSEIPIADHFFIGPLNQEDRHGSMIYSNHSCDPNIGVQGQIVFVAMRDIQAGEELTHDWATTDDEDYELDCRCGAPTCRLSPEPSRQTVPLHPPPKTADAEPSATQDGRNKQTFHAH